MTHNRFQHLHAKCRQIVGSLHAQYQFPLSDCDDMEQEMALALLKLEGHTDSYCLSRAAWAALDWLREMHGTRLTHGVRPVGNMTSLVDRGTCLRVWM